MNPDYSKLPEHMRAGAKLWIENGIATGGFLCAVIENNLKEAFVCADDINLARMRDIVGFFYDEAPGGCWGSPEKAKEWRKVGGWNGVVKKAKER